MPKKEFTGGREDFHVLGQPHGHRARKRHYEDYTDAELYKDIDNRRNAVNPSKVDFDSGDQDMKAKNEPQLEEGRWGDE